MCVLKECVKVCNAMNFDASMPLKACYIIIEHDTA